MIRECVPVGSLLLCVCHSALSRAIVGCCWRLLILFVQLTVCSVCYLDSMLILVGRNNTSARTATAMGAVFSAAKQNDTRTHTNTHTRSENDRGPKSLGRGRAVCAFLPSVIGRRHGVSSASWLAINNYLFNDILIVQHGL